MKTYIHKGTEKRGRLIATSNRCALASRIIAAVLDGETRPMAIAAMIEANAEDICMDASKDDSSDPMARTMPRSPSLAKSAATHGEDQSFFA